VNKALSRIAASGLVVLALISTSTLRAQVPTSAELQKKVERYLRYVYAFGPDVRLAVPEPKESEVAGLLVTTVELTSADGRDTAKMYISKDGKFLVRGEVADMAKDPMAENRAKIDLKGVPWIGNAGAQVTVVEFADFECPVCRQLHEQMKTLLPQYPQVKFYFKDFPIEQIHPWAKTAALAGRCAYNQDPKAFWKVYDGFYESQELISASNAWDKAVDFAGQAGLNQTSFRGCMASPDAAAAIDASVANARLLEVNSTPTVFVNGRRVVGADSATIERYIQYELANQKSSAAAKQ